MLRGKTDDEERGLLVIMAIGLVFRGGIVPLDAHTTPLDGAGTTTPAPSAHLPPSSPISSSDGARLVGGAELARCTAATTKGACVARAANSPPRPTAPG